MSSLIETKLIEPYLVLQRETDHGLPIVKRNDYHFDTIIAEGKKRYPNQPFMAINKRYKFVIYPTSSWDEFKRILEQTASVMSFQHVCNLGDWSLVGGETHELDAKMTFDTVIGHCAEKKGFNLLMTSLEIIAKINACTFVGRELGSNKRWVKAVMYSLLFVYMVDIETFKSTSDKRKLLVPKLDEDLPFIQFLLSCYTEAAATELKRMDSFLCESFRLHPITCFTLQRYVKEPFQLSDGLKIPLGVMAVFDMDRFYHLREMSGNDNCYYFVTTSSNSLGWGDGTQACPGRFFATSTLKIVMAYVIMNYDVSLSKVAPLKSVLLVNGSYLPDNSVEILFKSRVTK
ncbi:cytochrome P450 [Colletotrichum sublineola]|nr:cytochrome P450 [Colletotrichum sublineola]